MDALVKMFELPVLSEQPQLFDSVITTHDCQKSTHFNLVIPGTQRIPFWPEEAKFALTTSTRLIRTTWLEYDTDHLGRKQLAIIARLVQECLDH